MAYSKEYKQYIDEQLTLVEDINSKKMFGGVGYFKDGVMFGGIMDGLFHLKTDESNQAAFIEHGMKPWGMGNKIPKKPYYEVPEAIIADREELKGWVEKAYLVAVKAKKKKNHQNK